jgi:hypothetical protein
MWTAKNALLLGKDAVHTEVPEEAIRRIKLVHLIVPLRAVTVPFRYPRELFCEYALNPHTAAHISSQGAILTTNVITHIKLRTIGAWRKASARS